MRFVNNCTQDVLAAYVEHVALMAPFDVYTPKHHLLFHLVHGSSFHGNPRVYANWEDESLNRLLKATCRNVSQVSFDASVLARMRELLRRGQKR